MFLHSNAHVSVGCRWPVPGIAWLARVRPTTTAVATFQFSATPKHPTGTSMQHASTSPWASRRTHGHVCSSKHYPTPTYCNPNDRRGLFGTDAENSLAFPASSEWLDQLDRPAMHLQDGFNAGRLRLFPASQCHRKNRRLCTGTTSCGLGRNNYGVLHIETQLVWVGSLPLVLGLSGIRSFYNELDITLLS